MANEMTNIEMRNFTSVTGVNNNDNIVLVLSSGAGGKMEVALFKAAVTADLKPSISDGYWWIGSVNTGVEAAGKNPEFRKGVLGIEWKYTSEAANAWRLLVNFSDFRFKFEELTPVQRDSLRLKFSDLTTAEIAELQQPAKDMIAELQKTNDAADAAEKQRGSAENLRTEAERERDVEEHNRMEKEVQRENNESRRIEKESVRISNEDNRVIEFTRLKKESEAATAAAVKQASYAKVVGDTVKEGHITLTEAEYNELVTTGTVKAETFYYIIESE